ncbi:raf homolog serine/threonine-protein kinase Raf-like isoform X2 [Penaeus japonicus]|uniref:raf homolog serine/threonine-protein kinase Raf-like isoform X2 n=1 Tax=Penaeus japonicus TaxID=27405 RepID=UPI001C7139D6|nr:raf homolog serine/threonine-protein kinase Raf-like isoform X2 [Penaeus japonicus]
MAGVGDARERESSSPSPVQIPDNHDEIKDRAALEEELQNIQNIIHLTKEYIDDLNSRFAGFQHPPSLYLTEYTELTGKLHRFEAKEQEILEQLTLATGQTAQTNGCHEDLPEGQTATSAEEVEPGYPPVTQASSSNGVCEEVARSTPQSPLRSVVRAHLPNQQRTTVQVQPGRTLKEALAKALNFRKLSHDVCIVYRKNNPKVRMSWDSDIAALEGEEIVVEVLEKFPVTTSISHNFNRRTFFSLAFCDNCRRLLFHGFVCRTCGYRFHQRCSVGVPTLCQQDQRITNNIYQHLLASCQDNPAGILTTTVYGGPHGAQSSLLGPYGSHYPGGYGGHYMDSYRNQYPGQYSGGGSEGQVPPPLPRPAPAPLAPRDRSSSAPNVCINLVNPSNQSDAAASLAEFAQRIGKNYNPTSPGIHFFGSSTLYLHDSGGGTWSPPTHMSHIMMPSPGYTGGGGILAPPPSTSPTSSPTRPVQGSHSAQASPTNTLKTVRPRARSADESVSGKKVRQSSKDTVEDWEIPVDEILIGHRIGSGSFGTVYRGHWHGPVAVKTLNVRDPTPAQYSAFKNEVSVLKKTRHVNILLFMGCVKTQQLAIVTQWCEGSSLYKHLHVQENKFELMRIIDIARQTSQGMDYLHAKNIIHRDLKSNNIFLHDDYTVKIGDFGLATVKGGRWSQESPGGRQIQQPSGSILWMAPEVIRMQDENPYTFQSDVYAFGIVLYELFSGCLPYSHINNKDQILFMVGRGFLRPDMSYLRSDMPKPIRRILDDCIKYNRDDRPLFQQILANLESLVRSLPKIHRSASEPTLTRTHLNSDDMIYLCASPKTPINSGAFPFSMTGNI